MKNKEKQNRIIYLSVLAGLVYLFIIINSFTMGKDAFKTGYWEARGEQEYTQNQSELPGKVYFINLKPRDGFRHFPEQIHNQTTNVHYSARYNFIHAVVPHGEESPVLSKHFNWLKSLLILISLVLYITIPFVFIKLLRSLYAGNVFDIQNIRYARNLGIILLLLYFCTQGINYSSYRIHQSIFSFEDYKHVFNFTENYLLMMGIAVLLTAEILGRGLMLKEDQDLTI